MTPEPTAAPTGRPHADWLRTAALTVIVLAGGWWLLTQLAAVLRPLLLAVFLMYVLLPYYRRLRTRLPPALAVGLIAGATTLVLAALASALYASLLSFRDEVPQLTAAAGAAVRNVTELVNQNVPGWARGDTGRSAEDKLGDLLGEGTRVTVSAAGGGLVEMLTAGLYLLFLLIESDRFPARVRAAYPAARAEFILLAAARINTAIIDYLKAKVKSSVALTVPVWLVLTGSGVRFGLLWAVLTFLCNFIPYLGSVIAVAVPVGFAFLELGITGASVAAGLVVLCHVVSATVVEPMILGRAVGMSPLVILAALAVWGLVWGLPGMFLAVPLTVVLKLAAENLDATRSTARLLSSD